MVQSDLLGSQVTDTPDLPQGGAGLGTQSVKALPCVGSARSPELADGTSVRASTEPGLGGRTNVCRWEGGLRAGGTLEKDVLRSAQCLGMAGQYSGLWPG